MPQKTILRKPVVIDNLFLYQKSEVLYLVAYTFAQRFLHRGDRTVDQMVQAARSCKQNIVEGLEDGRSSIEMEIKLLTVAQGSTKELLEDFTDYLLTRGLCKWDRKHPRFDKMVDFCRYQNIVERYIPYMDIWNDEEMANVGISLCHIMDRMIVSYRQNTEEEFLQQGGIKERMTAARLGYRTDQRQAIEILTLENNQLKDILQALQKENQALKAEIEALKARLC